MANPEKGSIIIFDDDFEVGTEIQLMSRDNDLMLESARSGLIKFNEEIKGKNHIFSLYVNCAGRSCAWSGGEEEEPFSYFKLRSDNSRFKIYVMTEMRKSGFISGSGTDQQKMIYDDGYEFKVVRS